MTAHGGAETVFIIDDDEAVRDSLRLLLEAHSMMVRDFASVSEFLDGIEPHPLGCLILDLHLPVISGLDLLRLFSHRIVGLSVVMLTGSCDSEIRTKAVEAGVAVFLEKPVQDDQLISAVSWALTRAGTS